jgi:hypothetical protein
LAEVVEDSAAANLREVGVVRGGSWEEICGLRVELRDGRCAGDLNRWGIALHRLVVGGPNMLALQIDLEGRGKGRFDIGLRLVWGLGA